MGYGSVFAQKQRKPGFSLSKRDVSWDFSQSRENPGFLKRNTELDKTRAFLNLCANTLPYSGFLVVPFGNSHFD